MKGLLVLGLVAACASSTPRLHQAAEPARAAVPATIPAGTVLSVGHQAEGVAVDPVTHLAAIGVRQPFGVALVDIGSSRLVRIVAVPGHVRHLAAQGSTVLVPLEDTGALLQLSLPDGSTLTQTATDGYPHGVAAVGADGAVVGNEHGHRVTLIRKGSVVASAHGFPQPGGITATAQGVYVVDVAASTLTRLSSETLHRVRSVKAGNGPTHAIADRRGDVIVVDTRGDAVLVFSSSLRLLKTVSLPGTPYGVAYDAVRDRLWVTLTARNEVVCLAGPAYREVRRLPTVRQPNTVGVDSSTGTVVVASRSDGLVEVIR